jgi:uncharacterized protein YdaU (DUF1376 family)
MSRTWMPMYWGDYLRQTQHFDITQHGMYLLLIGHYWQTGGLPNDEKQLAAITKLSVARWRTLSPPVLAKFTPDLKHERIEEEIAKAEKKITLRAIAGQKGGLKSGVSKAIAKANAIANAVAKTKQPRTNHIREDIISSEQEAARETLCPPSTAEPSDQQQGRRWEGAAKPASQATRQEIEASFQKRKQVA